MATIKRQCELVQRVLYVYIALVPGHSQLFQCCTREKREACNIDKVGSGLGMRLGSVHLTSIYYAAPQLTLWISGDVYF